MISFKRKALKRIAILSMLTFMAATPAFAADETYILNTSTGIPYATDDHTGFQDLVVAEVFRRIGLKGRVAKYSASARALINANNAVDHGVAMRIKGLEKKFPNLVRVEEPMISNNFVAYSIDKELSTTSWQSLTPYNVVHINGWVIFERNLLPDQKKQAVKTPSQMFTLLDKGRTDFVLYEQWQGLHLANTEGLDVKLHTPPLASVDMFMYIHKNHADLAPKMAAALKAMKADGTYQSIVDKTLTPLLPKP